MFKENDVLKCHRSFLSRARHSRKTSLLNKELQTKGLQLETMPGIYTVTSIGNVHGFPNSDKLALYAESWPIRMWSRW